MHWILCLIFFLMFKGLTVQEIFKDVIGPDGKPMAVRQLVITQPLPMQSLGGTDFSKLVSNVQQDLPSDNSLQFSELVDSHATVNNPEENVFVGLYESCSSEAFSDEFSGQSQKQSMDVEINLNKSPRTGDLLYDSENTKDIWIGNRTSSVSLLLSSPVSIYSNNSKDLDTKSSSFRHILQSTVERQNEAVIMSDVTTDSNWPQPVHTLSALVSEYVHLDAMEMVGSHEGGVSGHNSCLDSGVADCSSGFEEVQLGDALAMGVSWSPLPLSPPPTDMDPIVTNMTSLSTPVYEIVMSPNNFDIIVVSPDSENSDQFI